MIYWYLFSVSELPWNLRKLALFCLHIWYIVVLKPWDASVSPKGLIKMKPCYRRVSWLLRERENFCTCLHHLLPMSEKPSARSLNHIHKFLNVLPGKVSQWKFWGEHTCTGACACTHTHISTNQNLRIYKSRIQTSLCLTSLQGTSMHIWVWEWMTFGNANKLYICRNVS